MQAIEHLNPLLGKSVQQVKLTPAKTPGQPATESHPPWRVHTKNFRTTAPSESSDKGKIVPGSVDIAVGWLQTGKKVQLFLTSR